MRRANADPLRFPAAKVIGHFVEFAEKRLDEFVKRLPRFCQFKWAAMEQYRVEALLKQRNLRTDRRLLDAIGNFANGVADALVLGHIVEQFEVMDVHREKGSAAAQHDTWSSTEQLRRRDCRFAFARCQRRGNFPP